MSAALLYALLRRCQANDEIRDILRRDYPVGGEAKWLRGYGGPVRRGCVLTHGYCDRIKVKNHATGAEYWIHAHDIVQ